MSFFRDQEQALLALSIVCHTLLLWRLSQAGISKYFYLKGLLIAEIIQTALLLPFSSRQTRYYLLYIATSPFVWAFLYLVILEFVRFILVDFPGISGAVRKVFGAALTIAIVLSGALTLAHTKGPTQYRILMTFVEVQRFVILALFLFLVLVLCGLFRFRVPLSKNRKYYVVGYSLYFGIGFVANLIVSELGLSIGPKLSLWFVPLSNLVLLLGVFLLSKQGEASPVLITSDERERRERDALYRQLEGLNRVLSRTGRN